MSVLFSTSNVSHRDIVLRLKDGNLQRINELHMGYEPLQYPIFYPDGRPGYSIGNRETQMSHYAQKLMIKYSDIPLHYMIDDLNVSSNFQFNQLHLGRKLFQQFVVDVGCKILTERLLYQRTQQHKLRTDKFSSVRDHISSNNSASGSSIGRRIILSSSFHGSPRFMHHLIQDGLAILRRYGKPSLFITMTCSPVWDEITSNVLPGQKSLDRPDLVMRIFHQKHERFLKMVKQDKIFGNIDADVWNREYQKRDLPHCHDLFWLTQEDRIHPDQIDFYVSAEIPNPELYPELYGFVLKYMIHTPCGTINPNAACMKDGKCSKNFPREFRCFTQIGNNSYPLYRRRSPSQGGFVGRT